jgi:hypothetical protein
VAIALRKDHARKCNTLARRTQASIAEPFFHRDRRVGMCRLHIHRWFRYKLVANSSKIERAVAHCILTLIYAVAK